MSMDELVTALAAAQAEFPTIAKGHTNPHFKSKYADLSDVLSAIRPVLAKHGIAVMQPIQTTDDGAVFLVTQLLGHGSELQSKLPLYLADSTPQQIGSMLTYFRRYTISSMLGIAPDDDDDGNAAQTAPQPRSEPVSVTPDMSKPLASMSIAELRGAAKEMGHDFGNGAITKAEMIRQLAPLVKALTGDEPFETDAPPIPYVEEPTKPFEPVVANPAAFVRRDDELRNLKPDVRASVRRGGD